jgi:AraC-like DNA-binding protein
LARQARHLYRPAFGEVLPHPIVFRTAYAPEDAAYAQHSHAWGEFVYSFSGVMELRLGDRQYLAPAQYGIWLPPHTKHEAHNRYETSYCSLYVAAELCGAMPKTTCALRVSPLVRALLEHLRGQAPEPVNTPATERLLQVLVDQLGAASIAGSYLPTSDDPLLGPILKALDANPGDSRSLGELARSVHTTERTLMRRCQRDLGMTLAQWRQRLRVVRAMRLLEDGETVENIAHDLGYSTASAFIAMFRRLMGVTPDDYRRGAKASPAF